MQKITEDDIYHDDFVEACNNHGGVLPIEELVKISNQVEARKN